MPLPHSIPDIMQHYYDCIVLAKQEVILATNYWQPSNSVDKISNSLRELSKRAGARGQKDLVVKIMWDRGQLSQAVDNHAMVDQEGREALNLPKLDDIPNLTMEVINFHRPIMGTFHAKFLIVDRKVALVNSNNIQDRPNLEMMVHLEGPVVESFYDIFLYSWHHRLKPVLPCLMQPVPESNTPGRTSADFLFGQENPCLAAIELVKSSKAARAMLNMEKVDDDKLAELREKAEKERAGQPFSPQARLQAVLGTLSDKRRGSFGSDASPADGSNQEARPTTLKFSDAVMQAYDRRRKSFQGTNGPRPALSTVPSVSAQEQASQQTGGVGGQRATQAEADPEAEPSMINWQAASSSEALRDAEAEVSSPVHNKAMREEAEYLAEGPPSRPNGDGAVPTTTMSGLPGMKEDPQRDSTRKTAPTLPALTLPKPSFDAPATTPLRDAGTTIEPAAVNGVVEANIGKPKRISIDTTTLQMPPPASGDRALSPILSERSSATHLKASTDHLPNGIREDSGKVDGLPMSNGRVGMGLEGVDTLMHPVDTTAVTKPLASGHVNGHVADAHERAHEAVPHAQPLRSTTTSSLNKESRTQSDMSQKDANGSGLSQRKSLKHGSRLARAFLNQSSPLIRPPVLVSIGRPRSKSGSIRSGLNGSALSGPPGTHTPRQRALSTALNAGALSEAWSTVEDGDILDEFNPHTLHKRHEPFPIAMVNRKPHGLPGHQDIRVPQDAAWLAGFRYAERTVFM